MKKTLLGFISGILVSVMLAIGIPAIAKSISKTVEIYYKDIKIYIEDKEVVPKDANGNVVEPFIMDETTYLPVRAVAESLGLYVQWDANTNSAKLSAEELPPLVPAKPAIPEIPVVEAVKYEKNVINSPLSIEMGADYSWEKHTISIPSVNSQTSNALAFNKKIENNYSDIITKLKNNKEGGSMYRVKFEYKIHDGILSIKVEKRFGSQNAGGGFKYDFFYYDFANDKELSLEGYISALGVKNSNLEKILKTAPDYAEANSIEPVKIVGCMLDNKSTMICFTSAMRMDGIDFIEGKPLV